LEGWIAKLESLGNRNPKGGPKDGKDPDGDKKQGKKRLFSTSTPIQSRKRCLEISAPTLYSAYGIIVGKLEAVPGPPLSCGVIIAGWPTWCFGLHLRG
jgi:hypothetical protein